VSPSLLPLYRKHPLTFFSPLPRHEIFCGFDVTLARYIIKLHTNTLLEPVRHTRPSSEAKWVHLSLPFSQLDLTLPKEQLKMTPTPRLRLSRTLRHCRCLCKYYSSRNSPEILGYCGRSARGCELPEEVGLGHRPMQSPAHSGCTHSRRVSTTMQIKTAAGSNIGPTRTGPDATIFSSRFSTRHRLPTGPIALPLSKSSKSLFSST